MVTEGESGNEEGEESPPRRFNRRTFLKLGAAGLLTAYIGGKLVSEKPSPIPEDDTNFALVIARTLSERSESKGTWQSILNRFLATLGMTGSAKLVFFWNIDSLKN